MFKNLFDTERVKDHSYYAASHISIDFLNFNVEMLSEEVLLGLHITLLMNHLNCEDRHNWLWLRLRLCKRHCWHYRHLCLRLLRCLSGLTTGTEFREGRLVNSNALLRQIGLRRGLVPIVVILLLILLSTCLSLPLVWILLRLVVAMLLIMLPGPATGLAIIAVVALMMIVLLLHDVLLWAALNGGSAGPILMLVVPALVVIPVTARLVLVVLLLILIPASATDGAHAPALFVPTLIIVSSAI